MSNVGNMNTHLPVAIGQLLQRKCIVKIFSILWVDGEGGHFPEIAAFFIFQASTNTGCFGSQGCSTKPLENNTDKIEEVEFEEVKADKK